jgi:hypothetical protein
MHAWLVLGNVALIAAATVTTALVIVYGVLTRWERSQVGRQFMLTKLCLATILDFSVTVLLFSNRTQVYTSFSPIRVFIYGAITAIMLRWLIIVIKTQHTARR